MKPLINFGQKFNINFFAVRRIAFLFSIILISGSTFLFFKKNLNFGIDFIGGIMIDVKFNAEPNLNILRNDIGSLNLGNFEIQEFGNSKNILIRVEKQKGDESNQLVAIEKVKEILPGNVDYRRIEYVGPKVGQELKIMGFKAVIFSLLAMFAYIWFRFSGWQFGLGAVIAVVHDVFSTIGFFSLTQLEFNLASIAAILTIAGYSINDTVVVFDRIRENINKRNKTSFNDLLNISVNETLSRTIVTSLTTLIALTALLALGGEVIKGFVIAMIWGVFIGTYSSIFIASPLIAILGFKNYLKEK
ncbi:MAG: protein translocase subunit SecF [Rickettsiales bacterium]|nr:protein translocase subunit SecF [Rickettsiales bacterium]OUV52834.1 MAG: protein translocase subunit SecF [Rickettsiales bacterium TMED127]|tara:strand:- start:16929 stop:17837 length:909 start_codon:yes stop_codon:yes gene_type:complete